MIFRILQFLFLISICSCSGKKTKFDVKKWNDESDRGFFQNRNAMLDDLMTNYHLKGKTIKQITKLFHYYDSSNNLISFEVYQEWKGIDPSYTKYLNLKLNKNKIVDSVYISEYRR